MDSAEQRLSQMLQSAINQRNYWRMRATAAEATLAARPDKPDVMTTEQRKAHATWQALVSAQEPR